MSIWETEPEDAARRQGRGPLSIVCSRVLRVSSSIALGPGIRCERWGKLFMLRPGQRYS